MKKEFEYLIENNTLIIKQCPDNILSYDCLFDIVSNNISKVVIEEGIEIIESDAFSMFENFKKIVLPSTLKIIKNSAFLNCKSLEEVTIPSSVEYIENDAFFGCENLRKVNIPFKVKAIQSNAFNDCKKLKKVIIEEGVEILQDGVFSGCLSLKQITLPNSVKFIGENAFERCANLRKINIPEGVETLNSCFYKCSKLSKISLPNSLKVITNYAFVNCINLKNINFPKNLELIDLYSFSYSGLSKMELPASVKTIGEGTFSNCYNLRKIILNDGLKYINNSAFFSCYSITNINIPDSVRKLEKKAFSLCANLKNIRLSKNIKSINSETFFRCVNLEKVNLPEGINHVELSAFDMCENLKEIHFPSSIKNVYSSTFGISDYLKKIFIQCNNEKKEIDMTHIRFINENEGNLFLYNSKEGIYSFFYDGEYKQFNLNELLEKEKIRKMIEDNKLLKKDYVKLYHWINKKIIPSPAVIKTMPIKDINNFFVNKNGQEWAKLIKQSSQRFGDFSVISSEENTVSFFKLCYVLGVFSESSKIRDKAIDFINNKIINNMDGYDIHSKFDGFNLNNGFNEQYAEFFIKYYDGTNFMVHDDIDLTAASYNNFGQAVKAYPNKTLHTNREADLLLPIHVINAISFVEYDNVEEGNENFALTIGRYGYTQQQFDELQRYYNKAKQIKKMKLYINKDKENNSITYSLLDKSNPLNAILGNITNCCQVIGGAGQSCVEYGMTMPNSGFITFNYDNKIIAQAWVWYDEINKIICLDNIEIPHKYLEKINQNKDIQKSFVECLLRIEKNFKEEMNQRGLRVNKVTIGKGYNDIKTLLDNNFDLTDKTHKLSGYSGYSDASSQYEIKSIQNHHKR